MHVEKARGHSPRIRGGNGQMTAPQKMLLERLGEGWTAELTVLVPNYQTHHLPKCLKIDIAHVEQVYEYGDFSVIGMV